jgi:hypothetical protein
MFLRTRNVSSISTTRRLCWRLKARRYRRKSIVDGPKPFAKSIREVRRFKYGSQTAFIHLCFAVDIELLRRKTRGNAASGRNLRRLKSRFFGNLATFGKASGFKGLGFFDYVYPNGKPDVSGLGILSQMFPPMNDANEKKPTTD